VDTGSGAVTVTLWRPAGPEEIALVAASGWREWPPRLPEQPIFYPVLNEEYASFIAREWNTKDEVSGYVGYVLRFQVRTDFLSNFQVQKVGGASALEYWIPADQLSEFNSNIVGHIEQIATFRPNEKDPL
jgi:hypothetical protein